VKRKERDI